MSSSITVSLVALFLLLTIFSSHGVVAQLNHTCVGANTATESSISSWCPQYSGKAACCTQTTLNTYFQQEIKICGQVFDHEIDGCAKELRGLLCFGLCAVDNTTLVYENEKSEVRVCHKFANGAYSACRGRLFCPLKTPEGKDNSNSLCHTDSDSKVGCYNIGEFYSSAEAFINAKVEKFFGVNEDTKQAVNYKPQQKYTENDDDTNVDYDILKPAGACFSSASSIGVSFAAVAVIFALANIVAF
eukprot:CAMPEP_0117451484 /NCGR_PEP_ID=MMETSP0759-20121206/9028_1 /TAXON_ID=63605 /ORGANISM="Percolomonas cosmopolitus, Strain WS" /LENGTH=244 /DNA_ID=CAMNT_0005244079 /DNA_START=7 /DNA_END=741 /DNA_ORIENTATION=+